MSGDIGVGYGDGGSGGRALSTSSLRCTSIPNTEMELPVKE